MRWTILVPAAFVVATTATGLKAGETLLQRAQDDRVVMVPDTDPDMAAAFRTAREQLPEFLKLARAPRPGLTGFSLKVKIEGDGQVEYFWIAPFTETDGRFTGAIANTPELVRTVALGQHITFSTDDVYDWMYRDHGWIKGNFTACALLKREPPSEAEPVRKHFRFTCQSDPMGIHQ